MKHYSIEHLTSYRYQGPVSDSFGHLRVFPRTTPFQSLISHATDIQPTTDLHQYEDYFGNQVQFFSVPNRHSTLEILAKSEVMVNTPSIPTEVLEVSIAEARQIYRSREYEHYDYLRPTQLVPVGNPFQNYIKKHLPNTATLGESLIEFNRFIHQQFEYQSGKTDVSTTAVKVARLKKGVCQDFSHFMLGVLRSAQIPARYVSGYIETAVENPASDLPDLIGSAATHAWVEVLLPGQHWWGLDPTNNLEVGDRHISMATGRDYNDVPPLRGTYRGAKLESLEVKVKVKRFGSS
ncbi:MAG: transglutaminase family protein [Verrucomicrobiota bacterium]